MLLAVSLTTLLFAGSVVGFAVPVALAIGVFFLLARRTSQTPTTNPPPTSLFHVPVDLGVFNGVFAAIAANDQSRMIEELKYLGRRAGEVGGMEALLERMLYSMLERKLSNPAARTPVLTVIAKGLGVTERQLLDALEGKTTPPTASTPVIPVAAPLVALALMLGLAGTAAAQHGPSHWHADVPAPQRFYGHENPAGPQIDPPLMHDAQGRLVAYQQSECRSVPRGAPHCAQACAGHYHPGSYAAGPVRRVARAPVRIIGRLFRWRR